MDAQKAGNTLKELVQKTEEHLEKIYEGGGKKAIAKQKEKGKLTARERLSLIHI